MSAIPDSSIWIALFVLSVAFMAVFSHSIRLYKARRGLQIALVQKNKDLESLNTQYMLKLQELGINNKHLEQRTKEYIVEYENLLQSSNQNIGLLKAEYENRLAQKDSLLAKLAQDHANDVEKLHASYDAKLKEELSLQEQKLNALYSQRQQELQSSINTDRERQEAIVTQRFSELSNKLLEEKAKQFQEKQDFSLKPLQAELMRFSEEIAKNTKDSNEKQVALHTEIRLLRDMSIQVSKDANNLTKALQGDTKTQGAWGEVILERLLESSGLQKDREYYTQFNLKDEDNKNLRPDALIQLPNNRFVVVDSKVSLNAYKELINSDSSQDNKDITQIFNAHIDSVRGHIKSLSTKEYNKYTQGYKLDFVIMFMPIEGAYNEVLRKDMELFTQAYNKGIILSSPSTLMVILRLIHNLWVNEARDKNTQRILNVCAKMIKKFDSFTKSMEKIGRSIQNASESYDSAYKQMQGRGSMSSYVKNLESYMSKIQDNQEEHIALLENDEIMQESS